jgi:hypothetical protein
MNRFIIHQEEPYNGGSGSTNGSSQQYLYGQGVNTFRLKGEPDDIHQPIYICLYGRSYSYHQYQMLYEQNKSFFLAMIGAHMNSSHMKKALQTRPHLLPPDENEFGAFTEACKAFQPLATRLDRQGKKKSDPKFIAIAAVFEQLDPKRNPSREDLPKLLAEFLTCCLELCGQQTTDQYQLERTREFFLWFESNIILHHGVTAKNQKREGGYGSHSQWAKLFDLPGVEERVGGFAVNKFRNMDAKETWKYRWAIEKAVANIIFQCDVLEPFFH